MNGEFDTQGFIDDIVERAVSDCRILLRVGTQMNRTNTLM